MYLKLLLSVAAFVFYNACGNVIYTADFVKDFKKFAPYSKSAPVLKDGKLYAEKGTLLTVKLPAPGRYKFTASVSGDSNVQLVVFTKPQYSYGIPASGARKHTLSVYHSGKSVIVCVATVNKKPFTLEALTVEQEKFTAPEPVDFKGTAFEAEDYPGMNGFTKKDSLALNSSYRSGNLWFVPVRNLPAPFTAKPLYLYARCRTATAGEGMSFLILSGQQRCGKITVSSQDFKWVRSDALDSCALNHAVNFCITGRLKGALDIDRVIWSTDPALTEKELDTIAPVQKKKADSGISSR